MIKPLAKSVLIPLGLTAAASATDAGTHKKILGSGYMTTLIISNDEIEDIIKIVTETFQNQAKEQKAGFLSMLLDTLVATLLGNLLTGKGIYRAGKGKGINRAGEGIVRAGYGRPSSSALHNNKMDF